MVEERTAQSHIVVSHHQETLKMETDPRTHLKISAHTKHSVLAQAMQMFMISREAVGCTQQTLDWYQGYGQRHPVAGAARHKTAARGKPDTHPLVVYPSANTWTGGSDHSQLRQSFAGILRVPSPGRIVGKRNPMDKVKLPSCPSASLRAFNLKTCASCGRLYYSQNSDGPALVHTAVRQPELPP